MSIDQVIKVERLSKVYKLYDKPADRLKEVLNPFRKKYHKDFFALKNVSFDVKKGETIGIIGKNGSGKSTLLKIITGVLTPTAGIVNVDGSVSSLLELGAGFNPELTGVENVYFNGTIMGYSRKDIDEKLTEIEAFADIGEHIHQPVKTYSSGMFTRLAFSVAVNVNPDILIIDEALSVGDMAFQEKSINRMKNFKNEGKTILFVSHAIPSVRNFCDRALWMREGVLNLDGSADFVCSAYLEETEKEKALQRVSVSPDNNQKKKILIEDVRTDKPNYLMDEDININLSLIFTEKIIDFGVSIIIYNSKGNLITLFNTVRDDIYFDRELNNIKLVIPENDFIQDTYYISAFVTDELAMFPYDKREYITSFYVEPKNNKKGIPVAEGYFRSKHKWVY